MLPFSSDVEVCIAFTPTGDEAHIPLAVRTVDMHIVAGGFEACEAFACDEVHNAAHSVRTVNNGRAVFQNFCTTNRDTRNVRQVFTHATSVKERQSLVCTETTKVEAW